MSNKTQPMFPDPTRRVATNIESWRRSAIQIVAVRHGRSGGVHAEMLATCATPELANAVIHDLTRVRTPDERIYAIGPDDRTARASKVALRIAIDDYIAGGTKGIQGTLI